MQIEITPEYLASQGLSADFKVRFDSKFTKLSEYECWPWTACTNKGYGCIRTGIGRGMISANRASWIVHRGAIPNGMHILHNCPNGDNPACVNPNHLWLGTHLDNIADMNRKGRHGSNSVAMSGENHVDMKYPTAVVVAVKQLFAQGVKRKDIVAQLKVPYTFVYDVIRGKSRLRG